MRLRSRFEGVVVVALALTACEISTKVGDLEDTESGGSLGAETSGASNGPLATTSTSTTTTVTDSGSETDSGGQATTSTTTTMSGDEATSSGEVEGTTSTTTTMTGVDTSGESGVVGCEGLDEAECTAMAGCKAISGQPHGFGGGGMCVKDEFVFLACAVDSGACPPFIPTVCPVGETEPKFDVPSGCIPPGFDNCDGAGMPPCP
jgi:hypothetical protein